MFEIFQRDQCEDFCVDLSMTSLAIGRQIQPEVDSYQSGKQRHRNKDLFLPEQEFFLLSVWLDFWVGINNTRIFWVSGPDKSEFAFSLNWIDFVDSGAIEIGSGIAIIF